MKHVSQRAILAGAIELKGDDDDPVAVVTKSLAELTKTVDDRLKALEGKGVDKAVLDRLDAVEKKANRPGGENKPDDAQQALLQKKGFGVYIRKGNRQGIEISDEESVQLKALTVSNDPMAGILAPNEMATEMIRDITQYSPIRSLASVRTTTSPGVTYPKRTGITNAKWKNEAQLQEESEPAFGQLEVLVHEVNTYADISNQLLADSGGQAETELRLALGEDFGQKEGAAFVHGAGVNDPEGITVNGAVGFIVTGNANTLGAAPADKMIDLFYGLKAAYRQRGTWLMNSTTLGTVMKLKDGQGNYLWSKSYVAGQPDTILGRPVTEDPEMPDIAAGADPILFGDIGTAYRIIDRIGLSILVNPYLLATQGLTRIHATRRVGGKVVQPAAIKKLRVSA